MASWVKKVLFDKTVRATPGNYEGCPFSIYTLNMTTGTLAPLSEAARTLESSVLHNICSQQQVLMMATTSLRSLPREQMPPLMRATPHKTRGPRLEEARSRDIHMTAAHWPQDDLIETRQPILCGVLNGCAALPMGQYRLQVPAGGFVFIPPMTPHPSGAQPHLASDSEDEFCDLFWLYRWEGGLICHLCHSRGARHFNFEASENCFLTGSQSIRYFDLLAQELEASAAAPPDSVSAQSNGAHYLLLTLLAGVQRDLEAGNYVLSLSPDEKKLSSTPKMPSSAIDNYEIILKVHHYIQFHIDQTLSIDSMARLASMSRAQFSRQFRQVSGCSFLEYLTKARLERTEQLLRETDLPVPLIARAVGLHASQLRNLFSRHLNSTLHEYRRQSRQGQMKPKKRSSKQPAKAKTAHLNNGPL
jgi:AraC-like DNA-binding protein